MAAAKVMYSMRLGRAIRIWIMRRATAADVGYRDIARRLVGLADWLTVGWGNQEPNRTWNWNWNWNWNGASAFV